VIKMKGNMVKNMTVADLLDDDFWVVVNGFLVQDPEAELKQGDIVMLIPKVDVGC